MLWNSLLSQLSDICGVVFVPGEDEVWRGRLSLPRLELLERVERRVRRGHVAHGALLHDFLHPLLRFDFARPLAVELVAEVSKSLLLVHHPTRVVHVGQFHVGLVTLLLLK